MSVKKNNAYYESASGLYHYDENGTPKTISVGADYSAGEGIKIDNKIISVSGEYLASATDPSLAGQTLGLKDNTWVPIPSSENLYPVITAASANAYESAINWVENQHYLTAHQEIPSAKWENASDVVQTNSAQWSENTGDEEVNQAVYNNSAKWNEIEVYEQNSASYLTAHQDISHKLDTTAFSTVSATFLTAINIPESATWNDVSTTVQSNSAQWSENTGDTEVNDYVYNNSGYINNTVNTVQINSSTWDKVTDKLDTTTFSTVSGSFLTAINIPESARWEDVADKYQENSASYATTSQLDTASSYLSGEINKKFDKEDITAYATNDWVSSNFLSSNALDSITGLSGKWDNVSDTVIDTSAKWNEVSAKVDYSAMTAYYTKEEINTQFENTSAWANDTFQPKGDYLTADALTGVSGNWNDTFTAVTATSANWNSAYEAVTASANTWNSVTAVSSDLETLSDKVETLSGELETASAFIEDQIDVLSGAIDDISDDIDCLSGAIDDKLDKDDFDTWSANADVTPYSAGKGLALNGHEFYVSADYAMSADVYNKDEVDEKIAKFGGYTTANADSSGYPDVAEPSTKFIYLVKMSALPASSDNYKEWIYTSADAQTTAWECIGETTLDLTPYLTKAEAAETYQPSGYYVTSSTDVISANKNYALTNDGTNVKWVELEDKDTIYSAGNYIEITNDNTINVTGLNNTYVTATNSTILVTPSIAQNGDVTYDLEATYPPISGINGISAGYVDDQYIVKLEDHLYSYAEAQTSLTTITTNPETITGFNNKNIIGDNISFVNDVINLEPGLYHIDMQVYLPIPGRDNNYYNVQLVPSLSYATLDQVIDGSFNHNDTLDLSFDIQLDSANTLTFEMRGLPTGYEYLVKNLQIHEVTTIDSVMQATGGTYRGGVATNIDNENKINVQYATASGLAVDQATNQLYVKLGEGLKFDTSGAAAGSLSLNNVTQEVVETVQELKTELDGKLTTNFPYPMINNNNTDFATYKGNGDNCICQLFSVSLTHKITPDTYFTVYMKDSGYSQTKVIFGIFEYNFDYWDEAEHRWRGQTNWVCDTGPVSLAKPTADTKLEFNVTHINPLHNELRSDRAYYAVLALKSDSGNGVFLACCDNYDGDVHSEPTLNWRWESVPNLDFVNPSGTLENTQWWDSGVNNYYEKADMRRFFLQIRNKVQPAPNP